MSFDTLAWAGRVRGVKPTVKLTLLALASCAGADHEAYPSTAWLTEFTGLDRKTVIAAIDALEAAKLLTDTGQRKGHTGQIKVYRLFVISLPETEQFQKRNSTVSSVKGSQKRDTELVREPVEKVQATPSPSPRVSKPTGFDDFWKAYPKKVGKPAAERSYLKACRVVPPDKILAAAQAYAASRADEDPQSPHTPPPGSTKAATTTRSRNPTMDGMDHDPWAEQDRRDSLGPVRSVGTPPATWSREPSPPSRPKVNPQTAALIGELATRYPVSRDADVEGYEARLQLLAEDCSDVDPRYLREAVRECGKTCDFMPTAAELRRAAHRAEQASRNDNAKAERNQEWIREANQKLFNEGSPLRWSAKGAGPWTLDEDKPPRQPTTQAERADIGRQLGELRVKLGGSLSAGPNQPARRGPPRAPTPGDLDDLRGSYSTAGASPALKAMLGITDQGQAA